MHSKLNKKAQGADAATLFISIVIVTLFLIVGFAVIRFDMLGLNKTEKNEKEIDSFFSQRFANSFFSAKVEGGTMLDLLMDFYFSGVADCSEFRVNADKIIEKTFGKRKCFEVYVNGIESCANEKAYFGTCDDIVVDSEIKYPAYGAELNLRLVVGD
jgi:hypothetical protein